MIYYAPKRALQMALTVEKSYELGRFYKKLFVGQEAQQQYSRVYKQRPVQVLPEIYANDPRYLMLMRELSSALREKYQIDVREDGLFGATAVGTNFTELLTIAGCPMNPMTYNPNSNERLRYDLGLCSDFVSPRHRKIFWELIKSRYAKHDGSRGKISKISGSGFPLFTHNVETKVSHLNHIVEHVDEILNLLVAKDFETLFKDHAIILASSSVLRTQAEGGKINENGVIVPKERMVNDLEYALTSGRSGRRFPANKAVTIDGFTYTGHFAGRARSAYAIPNPINSMFTAAVEGLRHYADNTYEFTYKHRSKDEMKRKAEKFHHFLPLDVGQYDQSMPWFLVKEWINLVPFSEKAKVAVELILKAPKFYSAVNDIHNPCWTGDLFSPEGYEEWGGLPSGAFLTSMLGKDLFSFAVLCMMDDFYHDVVGRVDSILKGDADYGFLNASDDTIIMANDDAFIIHLRNLQTTNGSMSKYFKVEIEPGFKFLGDCGYVTSEGEFKICSDIGSYFKNMLCPERGIDSKLRKYPMYGLMIRRSNFEDHPLFFEAEEIFLKLFQKHFNIGWSSLIEKHMVKPNGMLSSQILSQAEIEVMLDPNKLHYKFDDQDVPDDLVALLEEKISERNTEILTSKLISL